MMRQIVFLVFVLLSSLSIIIFFAIPREAMPSIGGTPIMLELLVTVIITSVLVMLSYWVMVDGEKLSSFCPACGTMNKPNSNYCLKCGHDMLEYTERYFCPNCERLISDYSKYCSNCGKRVTKEDMLQRSDLYR